MSYKILLSFIFITISSNSYSDTLEDDFLIGREFNYNNLNLTAKNTSGSVDKVVRKSSVIYLELFNKDFVPNFRLNLEQPEERNLDDFNNNMNIYSRKIEITSYYNFIHDSTSFKYGLSFRNQEDTMQFKVEDRSLDYTYSRDFIPLLYLNLDYYLTDDISVGSSFKKSYYIEDGYSEQSYYLEYFLYKTSKSKTSIEVGNIVNTYDFNNALPTLSTSGPYLQLKFNF